MSYTWSKTSVYLAVIMGATTANNLDITNNPECLIGKFYVAYRGYSQASSSVVCIPYTCLYRIDEYHEPDGKPSFDGYYLVNLDYIEGKFADDHPYLHAWRINMQTSDVFFFNTEDEARAFITKVKEVGD